MSRIFKLLWIFIALVCSFLLGYYLKPGTVDRGKALRTMGTMPPVSPPSATPTPGAWPRPVGDGRRP